MATPYEKDQGIIDTVKLATLIKKNYGRSSLTRSAKDTIAQFPVVFSGDIPTDDAVIIAKALEAQYAALMVSVISARSDYDRGQYSNPSDYLKTFHNNSNMPTLLRSMDSQLPENVQLADCVIESAVTLYNLGKLVDKDLAMESYEQDWFNAGTLNHSYRPEYATQKAMKSVVQNLRSLHRPAMEDSGADFLGAIGAARSNPNKDTMGAPTRAVKEYETKNRGAVMYKLDPATGKPIKDSNGNPIPEVDPKTGKPITGTIIEKSREYGGAATGKQEIVRNDKLTSLEPTLINLQLTSHHGDGPIITHNVVMGVKAKSVVIPQNYMISNLAEGVNNSRAIFKFIKWSEGELRLVRDLILGIDSARTSAVADRDMRRWLEAIRGRKHSNTLGKFTSGIGNSPMTTVVTTSYEVAKVAEMTGMDLNEPYTAAKLISKYFLLGFVIYDTGTGKIKSMFDGDVNFSVTTISGLKSKQQKDIDLMQYSQFIRAAGRM